MKRFFVFVDDPRGDWTGWYWTNTLSVNNSRASLEGPKWELGSCHKGSPPPPLFSLMFSVLTLRGCSSNAGPKASSIRMWRESLLIARREHTHQTPVCKHKKQRSQQLHTAAANRCWEPPNLFKPLRLAPLLLGLCVEAFLLENTKAQFVALHVQHVCDVPTFLKRYEEGQDVVYLCVMAFVHAFKWRRAWSFSHFLIFTFSHFHKRHIVSISGLCWIYCVIVAHRVISLPVHQMEFPTCLQVPPTCPGATHFPPFKLHNVYRELSTLYCTFIDVWTFKSGLRGVTCVSHFFLPKCPNCSSLYRWQKTWYSRWFSWFKLSNDHECSQAVTWSSSSAFRINELCSEETGSLCLRAATNHSEPLVLRGLLARLIDSSLCLSNWCFIQQSKKTKKLKDFKFAIKHDGGKSTHTLPFKSLGSLRNVFIFQRKALFFQ